MNNMMKEKLPLLISVPHGGTVIPPEIQTACLLNEKDIVLDGDTWTKTLYDFKDLVEEYHEMDIARIAVDLNRHQHDLPPENADGVVKTSTVDGEKVWETPGGLSELEREKLIQTYYLPYHHALEKAADNPQVKLAMDCHTMLDYGPSPTATGWEYRPLFCIGNRGTVTGGQGEETLTASPEVMTRLRELLEKEFESFREDAGIRELVTMNTPFKGGYITRHHGNLGKLPWIQLEINRKLYLPEPSLITVQPSDLDRLKLQEFRDRLYHVFSELVKDISPFRGKEAL
jgi:N-formylglutamate deformylase